jgi:hypothetical protein
MVVWKWIVRNEQLQVIGTIIADRNYVAELSRKNLSMSFAATGGFRVVERFALWLMGYPAEWASCGERAMQSSRKSRRPSLEHLEKQFWMSLE